MRHLVGCLVASSLLAVAGASFAAEPGTDYDGDGYVASDCAPLDPAVHPGATDLPDLTFEDMNCDGIDGNAAGAVFVAPGGNNFSPGTKDAPKKTIAAAIAAAAPGKDVYAAAGTYGEHVVITGRVGIYGGYGPTFTARSTGSDTVIESGDPEAVVVDGAQGVVLQLLTLHGGPPVVPAGSAYGLRAINHSTVALHAVEAVAANAAAGADGLTVPQPAKSNNGSPGADGCLSAGGGVGGVQTAGPSYGGKGGNGATGAVAPGQAGDHGEGNAGGGAGGTAHGGTGGPGQAGTPGSAGPSGAGAHFSTDNAAAVWSNGIAGAYVGENGAAGGPGTGGNGGGGGGGSVINNIGFQLKGGGGGAGGAGGASSSTSTCTDAAPQGSSARRSEKNSHAARPAARSGSATRTPGSP
jgi:hypothetical protein